MKSIFLSTILASGIATAAFAGNLDTPAPVVVDVAPVAASVTDWSGFYLGAAVSAETGDFQYEEFDAPVGLLLNTSGTMYGAFAGYNFQRGNIVFGAEVSYSAGSIAIEGFPAFEFTNLIDLNGRVGFAAGRALIYATAGATLGDWVEGIQGTYAVSGYNYGAGVDFMLTDRIFLGVEYLVRDLSGSYEPLAPDESFSSENQSIRVRAGITF